MWCLFPEGTYVRGRVGEGKYRLIQMILKLQAGHNLPPLPFVPVGLSYEARPRSSGWQVVVRVGKPLQAQGPKEAQAFTQAIMEAIGPLWQG